MTPELSLVPVAPQQRVTWVEAMERGGELAETIANTDFVPKSLRGNPAAILAAILYGHELGLEPMRSLSWVHVIDGRPALAAAAQRALILGAGHELWVEESTAVRAVVAGRRRDGKTTARVVWTIDDAKRARIAGKPNWSAYPRQMLVARATSELAQQLFADVIGGIPSTADLDVYDGDVEDAQIVEDSGEGGGGSGSRGSTRTRRRKRPTPAPPPEPTPEERAAEDAQAAAPDPPSEAMVGKMFALFGEKLPNLTRDQRLEYSSAVVGRAITTSSELSGVEVSRLIEDLEARESPPAEMPDAGGGTLPANEQALLDEARAMGATDVPLPGDDPPEPEPAADQNALPGAAPPEPSTDSQRRKIGSLFRDLGVTERADKFATCSNVVEREIRSATDLTRVEADRVIVDLERQLAEK